MTSPSEISSKIRVGLMGFGRIGRNLYRLAYRNPNVEIVVISDIGRPEILHYVIQRDTIYRDFKDPVALEGNSLVVNGRRSRLIHGVAPGDVPWDAFGVDLVVDSTSKYRSAEAMKAHLNAGAKRVIISTVPEDYIDRLIVVGVNESTIQPEDRLISAGSSTTNALALMLKILDQTFDIDRAMMTTIHAYTSDQPLQDRVGTDFRRSRSAAENIIPNENWSARWVQYIMPKFKDKIESIALNVPVPDGSCLDLTTRFNSEDVTADDVNNAMRAAAAKMPDIVEVTDDPIVSSDVRANTHTLVFDSKATLKSRSKLVKTLCWYDNGYGHARRIIDIIEAYSRLSVQGGAA